MRDGLEINKINMHLEELDAFRNSVNLALDAPGNDACLPGASAFRVCSQEVF